MILEIRLHGRGGQGIKTAGQILGTAAFLSGFQAQDFPLYGAERRGAPIVAFTRISDQPIQKRGPIARPDILMVGDATLLEDAKTGPLCGTDASTAIFINSTLKAQTLKDKFKLPALPATAELTQLGVEFLERGNILSTALAAAAAKITGKISWEALKEAIEVELEQQGFAEEIVQKNTALAAHVFEIVKPAPIGKKTEQPLTASRLIGIEQHPVAEAAPVILAQGNMGLRKTGNWRLQRPVIDYEKCNHCLICYARCPDGVIAVDPDGKPVIDYDHCKGCLICAQECPLHIIQNVWEVEHADDGA